MSAKKGFSMIDEYFNIYNEKIKEYGKDIAVLIECGSFMEIYQIDNNEEKIGNAYEISKILNICYANKNGDLSNNNRSYPNFVGFTTNSMSKYLPILLENNYTVILVNQLETNGNKKGKLIQRGVTAVYSKCLQPLEMDTNADNQLLYISLDVKLIHSNVLKRNKTTMYELNTSICCVNNFTNSIEIYENNYTFTKDCIENCLNDFDHLLYKFFSKDINIHFVGENIINFESELLKFFNSRYDNMRFHNFDKQKHKEYIKTDYQNEYFKKVYNHINFGLLTPIEYLNITTMPSLSIVNLMYTIDFIGRHDLKYIRNLSIPKMMNDSDHLFLALDTLNQLNIDKGVFDIVNCTKTAIGKRYLKSLLCKPLKNPNEIEYRYKLTDELESIINTNNEIDQLLSCIIDFEKLHRKMSLEVLHPFEFEKLHTCYKNVNKLINVLSNYPLFHQIIPNNVKLNVFNEYINSYMETFDFDKLKKYNLNTSKDEISNYFLKGVIVELDEIQLKIDNITEEIERMRVKYNTICENNCKTKNPDYIKIAYTETEGYSFSCTKIKYQTLINAIKESSNFKIKQTNNIVKFFTPELVDLSNKLLTFKDLLKNKINLHYISTLKLYYYNYHDLFTSMTTFIQILDVVNSNLKCKNKYNYCRPIIDDNENDSSFFKAVGLRHPIIEVITQSNKYIPNDIVLDDNNIGILLYGLNSSGKSSLLRAIGIAVILAQCGLFVPCNSFIYKPFHTVISQVDLSDNMYIGKSSFITEMAGLKKILDLSGKNTLVLADELCRGTETYSAISIVCSTMIKLIQSNTKFFFTTHLHQIPQLKRINTLKSIDICHLSVTIKNSNIIFNRKIEKTSGDPLYGLEVCKTIINDNDFINDAFEIRNELTRNNTQILSHKKSNYNKKKITSYCEMCNSCNSLETHHITEQYLADKNGIMPDGNHKNNLYNLITLCHDCHLKVTLGKIKTHGYIQTINGRILDYNFTEDTTEKV